MTLTLRERRRRHGFLLLNDFNVHCFGLQPQLYVLLHNCDKIPSVMGTFGFKPINVSGMNVKNEM